MRMVATPIIKLMYGAMIVDAVGNIAPNKDVKPNTNTTPPKVPQSDLYPPMITAAKTFKDNDKLSAGSEAFVGVIDKPMDK